MAASRSSLSPSAPSPHVGASAPDAWLVVQARSGDLDAFSSLVQRHQDRIFAVVRRWVGHAQDAEDLVQETFIKAHRALAAFEDRAAFTTWLTRIAINTCISHRRSRGRNREVTAPMEPASDEAGAGHLPEPQSAAPGPSDQAHVAERAERVQTAIASLEEDQRSVVVLRDVQGHGYEEIAEILQIPVGTVRSRLHRARQELALRLVDLMP